ncbi:long-chain fatty acid--CoA ligase [Actinocrinis puniceicyclus]|uniref:Long-chain fatty acid--CoA ligase n=1 Tax=Actinocrinis puniceicyclus TaxID=977794 RepID=A0A8J7WTS7_9ACTN|nr:long-chain fatty acid--CoA ligase [Actinocrinis puniceicyclus]MBS2965867.1 long-chain fatty acid--CoA ligase [Actinocrinis puniceicyclus]
MLNAGLGAWPARRAAMSPDRTALVFRGRATSYAELAERTARLADRLRAAGVRSGDRVAYLGQNHPAFVETMFATAMLGGIFVPVNFRLTAAEVDYVLEHCGACALVYAREHEAVVRAAVRVPAIRVVVAAQDHDGPAAADRADRDPQQAPDDALDDALDYERWLASGNPEPVDVPVGLDDPAFILYTSGTTGRPKGAVLTHGNLVWNCYNLLIGVDVAGDSVSLTAAPLFHVAALNQLLLPTFLKGGCSVLMPTWDVDACFDLVERYRVTWMFGVTAMFAGLTQSSRWAGADLGSVRCLMAGGAPVPRTLIEAYQERGLVFCQGYGLTETAPGATFLEAAESVRAVGSAGCAVFFTNVRCVRPDMADAAPGELGEVVIQGPNVTPGYWNDPDATAAAFSAGGWFHSGDIARVDEHGMFHIVDRVKDMYISGGENVYPAEVEAALFAHPAVAEAAVVGVPDEKWGEVGRAFVVPARGLDALPDPAHLRAFLAGRLAKYKIPVYFDFVDDLPRTASRKVQKGALRARSLGS